MKLISLNTWGGRAGKDGLLDFFRKYNDIDIFCLQEVWEGGESEAPKWGKGIDTAMITNISTILKYHTVFFRSHFRDFYGLAIFIKKNIRVVEEGEIFVVKEKENIFDDFGPNHARNLQHIKIETARGPVTLMNFHGLWNGVSKEDTDERIGQSDKIIKFLKNISHDHVLTGDFNLLPDTKSLKMIEAQGLRNLIAEFGVTSTRTRFYTKPEKFADYTFVSDNIQVNEFKILPDEVSDHAGMYLEFQ